MCHTMAGAPVDLMMMLFGDYRLYRLTMGGGGGGGVKREGIINNKLEKLEWRSTSLLCNLLTRSSVIIFSSPLSSSSSSLSCIIIVLIIRHRHHASSLS